MGNAARKSNTVLILGGVLVVICLLVGMAIVIPDWGREHRVARAGSAQHFIDNLAQAAKNYELDHNAYPPGDGTGSKGLVAALSMRDPKGVRYFEFMPDMLDSRTQNILNPVYAGSDDPVARLIYYRNDLDGSAVPGGPAVRPAFSIWAAGAGYKGAGAGHPTARELNNWE